jgi:hypothetical protein
MSRRKNLSVVADPPTGDDRPITQGMLLSWGKIIGFIVPLIIGMLLTVWKVSGDIRAAEMHMNGEIGALKESAIEWKAVMKEATKALNDLTITVVRADERLKALEKEK